jgi:hypothetical protein
MYFYGKIACCTLSINEILFIHHISVKLGKNAFNIIVKKHLNHWENAMKSI